MYFPIFCLQVQLIFVAEIDHWQIWSLCSDILSYGKNVFKHLIKNINRKKWWKCRVFCFCWWPLIFIASRRVVAATSPDLVLELRYKHCFGWHIKFQCKKSEHKEKNGSTFCLTSSTHTCLFCYLWLNSCIARLISGAKLLTMTWTICKNLIEKDVKVKNGKKLFSLLNCSSRSLLLLIRGGNYSC